MTESREPEIIRPPEFGLTSQLLEEFRAVIDSGKYDRLKTSELIGVLEMIKLEYVIAWKKSP